MYKWSKQFFSDGPSTPKLASVSLPDPGSPKHAVTTRRPSALDGRSTKPPASVGMITDRRSMTPLPGSSKPPRASTSGGQSSRSRTASMTGGGAETFVRPMERTPGSTSTSVFPGMRIDTREGQRILKGCLKGSAEMDKGGSRKDEDTESCPGSSKAYMKGGGPSHSSSKPKHLDDWTPAHASGHDEHRHAAPAPSHRPAAKEDYRLRKLSLVGHRGPESPSETPKYMKVTTKHVPLKEEAVSLSWLLVDYSLRAKVSEKPRVIFDVAFKPDTRLEVQAYTGGYIQPLSSEECRVPASTHCTVTDMRIVCEGMNWWPIVIHRRDGIRCLDVLRAIYETYHVILMPQELTSIGRRYIEECASAFEERCRITPGLSDYNRRRGMRRVDLLKGRRMFKGLTRSANGDWELHLDSPKGLMTS